MNKILKLNKIFLLLPFFGIIILFSVILGAKKQSLPTFTKSPFSSTYKTNINKVGLLVSLSSNKNKAKIEISRNNSTLQMGLPINNAKLDKIKEQMVYSIPEKSIEIRYQTLSNGIKEEIVLNKKPGTNQFESYLNLKNLSVQKTPAGILAFYDKNNNYQFNFEKPFVKDASGDISYNVDYSIREQKQSYKYNRGGKKSLLSSSPLINFDSKGTDTYILSVTIDEKWLFDSNRAYPIIIDPTVIRNTQTGSTGFNQTGASLNRVTDTGAGATAPNLTTYYQELGEDIGLGGLWHMNEGSGTTTFDASGLGNTGALGAGNSAPTWGNGIIGTGLSFDGVNDYLSVAHNSAIEPLEELTYVAWIKPSDVAGTKVIMAKNDGNVSPFFLKRLQLNNDEIQFNVYNGANFSYITTGAGILANNWYHIAVSIKDNNFLKIYVGGVEKYSTTSIGDLLKADTGSLIIGARPNTAVLANFFKGFIDEVAIYNRALSPEEIKMQAQRRPYSVYTSEPIDLTAVTSWNSLAWTEVGVGTTGNIEFLTRVGNSTDPNDGTWDAWAPIGTNGSETQIDSMDVGGSWIWDMSSTGINGTIATYEPKAKATDTNIKMEGTGSQKLSFGIPQTDANTVGLWHLEETGVGTGSTLYDSSANNYHSIATGTSLVDGFSGKARSFNGSSDYITSPSLGSSPTTESIELWIKPSTKGTLIAECDNATCSSYHYTKLSINADNTLLGHMWNMSGVLSFGKVNFGQWYYVAMTYDGTTLKGYLNGNLVGSKTGARSAPGTLYLLFGRGDSQCGGGYDSCTTYYSGTIDEVKYSNSARTAEEIAENYRAGQNHRISEIFASSDLSGKTKLPFYIASDRLGTFLETTIGESAFANYEPDSNTLGLWHLDEQSGSGAYLKDSSNGGNNATPYVSVPAAVGGTVTYSGGYTIHTFKGVGVTFTPNFNGSVEVLVIGGGGKGGTDNGGGGGAGGLVYHTSKVVMGGVGYTAMAGVGGTSANGGDSVFSDITALGGGKGASGNADGSNGGSGGGGGGSVTRIGGTGTQTDSGGGTGYKNNGGGRSGALYAGGGGGGAAATGTAGVGGTSGAGGIGRTSSITGTNTYYAGGGGGGGDASLGIGGSGGGGKGGSGVGQAGTAGTANTGGGGGGGSGSSGVGGNGGSGIVIVRYPSSYYNNSVQGKIGKARLFNGTSDYISPTSGTAPSSTVSIDAWIYPTNASADNSIYFWGVKTGCNASSQMFNVKSNTLFFTTGCGTTLVSSASSIQNNTWYHTAATVDASGNTTLYINGVAVVGPTNTRSGQSVSTGNDTIGSMYSGGALTSYFTGIIDEVRVSNVVRTATEIRQAYEAGLRTHSITIDFKASIGTGTTIANSSALSFTIDETAYGSYQKASHLFLGDKIIIKQKIGATEYVAQGTVSVVNTSTGAITVTSWDAGSTFPSAGFDANATVFKWQREYFDIRGSSLSTDRDAITRITARITDGSQGANVWLDDFRSAGPYMTNPAGSGIFSSIGKRYFQYRSLFSSWSYSTSPSLTSVTVDYTNNNPPTTPTIENNKYFDNAKIASATPIFNFKATDPDAEKLSYNIQISTDNLFNTIILDDTSTINVGFTNTVSTGETKSFTQNQTVSYTTQTPLTNGVTYWYRVRAKDAVDWTSWTAGRSFTIDTSLAKDAWFQTVTAQFTNNTFSGSAQTNAGNYIEVTNGQTVIDTGDSAGSWVSSDAGFAISQETTIKHEGTGAIKAIGTSGSNSGTGGTISSGDYTIHTFTSSGTFTPNFSGNVEALVVAGGGGGGGGHAGGGGGAGGFTYNASFGVTAQAYTITVGNGGSGALSTGAGYSGVNSVFSTITSTGGGGGAYGESPYVAPANGGSGGGASGYLNGSIGASGISGQGSNGGNGTGGGGSWGCGGGGGGAGAIGNNGSGTNTGGAGGIGTSSSITGSSTYYAGGGGGGGWYVAGGIGGSGGGGAGANSNGGTAGTANTGGGGGGSGATGNRIGGAGGSGIVIIRYPTNTSILNATTTLTKSPTDLSAATSIKFWVRSSRAGSFMRFQMGESASTEQTYDFTINSADTWEQKTWDISGITGTARDAITKYAFKVINADSVFNFYFDDIQFLSPSTIASADLSNIALNKTTTGGYTFSPNTYDYTGIGTSFSSINITPTGSGVITVEGTVVSSGTSSPAIALSGSEKTVTIITTESCKSPKIYTLKITQTP